MPAAAAPAGRLCLRGAVVAGDAVRNPAAGLQPRGAGAGPGSAFADVDEFRKERLDLELAATAETAYYAGLRRYYGPVRLLAGRWPCWSPGAGVFAAPTAAEENVAYCHLPFLHQAHGRGTAGVVTLMEVRLTDGGQHGGVTAALVPAADTAVRGLLVAAVTGLLAAAPPALRAARTDIVPTLRHVG